MELTFLAGTRAAWRSPAVEGDSLRPEVVRRVREQIQAGRYRPPVTEVAELLAAWLFLDDPHPNSAIG